MLNFVIKIRNEILIAHLVVMNLYYIYTFDILY